MKNKYSTETLVYLIAFTFASIFWREYLGINTLIFVLIVAGSVLLQYGIVGHPYLLLTTGGTVVAAAMVVLHNSLVSKLVVFPSLVVMIGFAQQRQLKFILHALLLGLYSIMETPKKFFFHFNRQFQTSLSPTMLLRKAQFSFLPIVVVSGFYSIYYFANANFATLSNQFWQSIWQFIWDYLPYDRLILFMLGGLIAGGALWKTSNTSFLLKESRWQDHLMRIRKKVAYPFGMTSLRKEFRQGVLILLTLNLLLFVVNILDLQHVWWSPTIRSAADMRQYVHEGTYLLIVAILLAMAVLLFYFRGNLNFLSNNLTLKRLSYLWIIQNAFLALSVACRNFQYIQAYQLAYKRIGVFIFLTLVLFGLVTLTIKISQQKSMYYLLIRNAIATYCIWILMTCINWDTFITDYNIRHAKAQDMDLPFLLEQISHKNYYLLVEYQNRLEQIAEVHGKPSFHIQSAIDRKREAIKRKRTNGSWLSWNFADAHNWKYLDNQ